MLLDNPTLNINSKHKWEDTALVTAARNGNYEVVDFLVGVHSIDINSR